MTFSTQRLVNSRTLVTGTDKFGTSNSTVIDSRQWDSIKEHDRQHKVQQSFDEAVEGFFAPLLESIEKVEATAAKADDPLTYVVLHEGTDAVAGVPADVVHLNQCSQILRLLENNEGDRLVWVGNSLEILEADTALPEMTDETSAALDEAVNLVKSELGGTEV